MGVLTFRLETLSPIWTGDMSLQSNRVKETGIVGSLRWWCEALVRGLGGYACDPTDDGPPKRCEFNVKAYERAVKAGQSRQRGVEKGLQDVCTVCRLFGCTGWSRKFRVRVCDDTGQSLDQLNSAGLIFRLMCRELRPLRDEEKWLLYRTVWLISEYGSMGGRTPRKPTDNRKARYKDYGLVKLLSKGTTPVPTEVDTRGVQIYLEDLVKASAEMRQKKAQTPESWANLSFFFFKPGAHLRLGEINELLNKEPFLKGRRGDSKRRGASKKIFSFEGLAGQRLWGYTKSSAMLDKVIDALPWPDVKRGSEVIANEL